MESCGGHAAIVGGNEDQGMGRQESGNAGKSCPGVWEEVGTAGDEVRTIGDE